MTLLTNITQTLFPLGVPPYMGVYPLTQTTGQPKNFLALLLQVNQIDNKTDTALGLDNSFNGLNNVLEQQNTQVKIVIDEEIENLKFIVGGHNDKEHPLPLQGQRALVNWVLDFVDVARKIDPTFKTGNSNELDLLCYAKVVDILENAGYGAQSDYLKPDTEYHVSKNVTSDVVLAIKNEHPPGPYFEATVSTYKKFIQPEQLNENILTDGTTIG